MRKITAVLLGAGQRGADAYASYALRHPDELQFVAVAEPRNDRREAFCRIHGIKPEFSFSSWEQLMEKPRLADCILICTQDKMHYRPLLSAMEKEYAILCEKPITPSKEELLRLQKITGNYDHMVGVAHVLRFSPFFMAIKKMIGDGEIGNIVNIQHMEAVGYWHMAHSFVRGNWNNSQESCPMILAKCCHDFDMLLWLIDKECISVSSYGGLYQFTQQNAPGGSTEYCLDGCEARNECPYYAPRFYLEHPKAEQDGFCRVVSLDPSPEAVLEALKKGPYGRCVYRCHNNVVDHQIVNMQFSDGVTASLTMCAFTERCERVIQIMGTRGQIIGNMEDSTVELRKFVTGNTRVERVHVPVGGHSGSDSMMMESFIRAVASGDKTQNRAPADQAIMSHLIALAAEKSRVEHGRNILLSDFCQEGKLGEK